MQERLRYHPQVRQITSALVNKYGKETLGNKKNPFNELLYIVLSSKTPPNRYKEVYRTLKRAYPKAENLALARWEDVASVLVHAGLQNRKARAIVTIAQRLIDEFGQVTLAPLSRMMDDEAERFLTSLPEINKKSARCILLYSFNRQVFPVDSHCHRISQRLGWIPEGESLTDHRADELQAGVPKLLRRDLHVGMVLLGRDKCLPKEPCCKVCPIKNYCPTGRLR